MNKAESIRINEDRVCRFRRIADGGFRLAIEVTGRCNLSCKHCFVRPSQNHPATDEIIGIIRQAERLNCRKLIITGGEPLMREDLEQIISEAASLGILADLNSNLYDLTRGRACGLKAAGLKEASVSLYGVGCFHDELTGRKGSFDRALNGIDLLREAGITVDVHGAVWDKMLPCIHDLIDTAQKHGVSSITFFSLIPTETWGDMGEYIVSPDLALKAVLQERQSASMPIRTIGLRKIENDECTMGNDVYGVGTDMRLVPCLLSRHRNNETGVDLRVHSVPKAMSLLETRIKKGEWHRACCSNV